MGRHPRDGIIALAAFAVATLCSLVVLGDSVNPVEAAIAEELRRMPAVPQFWHTVSWLGTIWAVGVATLILVSVERFRMAIAVAVGGGASYVLAQLISTLVGPRPVPAQLAATGTPPFTEQLVPFPSAHVAVAAALAAAAAPYLGQLSRDLAWVGVVAVALADIVLGTELPLDVFAAAALGVACATGMHVVVGAPGRRTSEEAVVRELEAAGVEVESIAPVARHWLGPLRFAVRTPAGDDLAVKVVHRMHRRINLWYKFRRLLRSLGAEVEPRLSSPWHEADHEALVTMLAERAGVRTPRVQLVSDLGHGPAIVVREHVEGRRLCDCTRHDLRGSWLDDLWRQVRLLDDAGIAHHDLRGETLQIDEQGRVSILDFTFAEAGAPPEHRAQDVAEVLVCLVPLVGVEAAVASAARHLEPEMLCAALPYLHPLALPPRIRGQLDDERPVLTELREAVAERAGTELPTPGWPVKPSTIVSLCVLGLAVYVLLPQFATLGRVAQELREADIRYVAASLVAGLLIFPVTALTVMGASRERLGFWRTTAVQVAATFAGRITPGGVGLLGVNYTYLERLGMGRSRAAGVIALNRAAGLVVGGAGIGFGILVLGASPVFGRVPVPPLWSLLAGAAGIMVLAGIIISLPPGRRVLRSSVRVAHELAATLRRPVRSAQLLGGSAAFLVVNGLGLAASVAAFGPHLSVLAVVAVYMVGGTLGGAAPTPGGLGAVEAALVAGLTATGTTSSVAVAGVLTYRLMSFWLPVAVGPYVSRRLQRRRII